MKFFLAILLTLIVAVMCVLLIWVAAKFKRKLANDINENERKEKASKEGVEEILRNIRAK